MVLSDGSFKQTSILTKMTSTENLKYKLEYNSTLPVALLNKLLAQLKTLLTNDADLPYTWNKETGDGYANALQDKFTLFLSEHKKEFYDKFRSNEFTHDNLKVTLVFDENVFKVYYDDEGNTYFNTVSEPHGQYCNCHYCENGGIFILDKHCVKLYFDYDFDCEYDDFVFGLSYCNYELVRKKNYYVNDLFF